MRRPRSRSYDVAFYAPSIGPLLTRETVPPTGGAETQIFLLSRALAERGVRVCLCAFDIPGGGIPASLGAVDISLREPYRGGRGLASRLREILAMRRALMNLDADVVVTRTASFYVGLAGLFTKLAGRRFIYSSANIFDFDFPAIGLNRRDLTLYRLGVRLADRVVVQSDEQARLCMARFGRTPIVIKNIAERAPIRTAEPEAFLWIGRAISYKRPLEYIELARSVPEAEFWMIAVPGPAKQDLSAEIDGEASTVPNLKLLAPRPRNELAQVVDRAVAVVNTSDFEGMPNATLEGWARGVPALTLAYDPDGLIERHGLGEFAHGSQESFIAGARKLWQERDDQRELAERCRRYVAEDHSEEAVATQWERALGLARSEHSSLVLRGVEEC